MSFSVIQASQAVPVSAFVGKNGNLPIDPSLLPVRGPNGGLLHILKFIIRVDSVTSDVSVAGQEYDGAALAHLIETVSLQAAPNGPLGGENAQIINTQSGYLAQQALCAMTGAPVQAVAEANYINTIDTFDANGDGVMGSATGMRRTRRLNGWAHEQGPFIYTSAGTGLSGDPINYVFAVGERAGEIEFGGMNPIPVGAFTGAGGVSGPCKGGSAGIGQFQLRLRSSIQSGAINLTYSGSVTVYAQVIELPFLHIPLAPCVSAFTSNTSKTSFPVGIPGLHAFMEDLKADTMGMQLPDMTGVTYIDVAYKGVSLWPTQTFGASMFGSLTQLNGQETERFSWQDMDVSADKRTTGTFSASRYSTPGRIVVLHRGPAGRSYAFGDNACTDALTATLIGSPTSVTRQCLSGYWKRSSDAYVSGWKDYSGTKDFQPMTTFGAMSPSAQARGMLMNVPLRANTVLCG